MLASPKGKSAVATIDLTAAPKKKKTTDIIDLTLDDDHETRSRPAEAEPPRKRQRTDYGPDFPVDPKGGDSEKWMRCLNAQVRPYITEALLNVPHDEFRIADIARRVSRTLSLSCLVFSICLSLVLALVFFGSAFSNTKASGTWRGVPFRYRGPCDQHQRRLPVSKCSQGASRARALSYSPLLRQSRGENRPLHFLLAYRPASGRQCVSIVLTSCFRNSRKSL